MAISPALPSGPKRVAVVWIGDRTTTDLSPDPMMEPQSNEKGFKRPKGLLQKGGVIFVIFPPW